MTYEEIKTAFKEPRQLDFTKNGIRFRIFFILHKNHFSEQLGRKKLTSGIIKEAGFSTSPAVAALENNVYVVWQDQDTITEDNEILYRKSTDGGMSFGTTVNLSNEEGNQAFPDIAASLNIL
jgi:hypothetical protein